MNEFENNNGFHNENVENNPINEVNSNKEYSNGGYNNGELTVDVTPTEETAVHEQAESHRYSYKEQGTGGNSGRYDYGNDSHYSNSYSDSYNDNYSNTYNNNSNYYSNIPPEPDKRRRKRKNDDNNKNGSGIGKKIAKLVASAAIFGLVAGTCFVGVSVVKDKFYPSTADKIETTSGTTSSKKETSSGSGSNSQNVASVVNEVMPSVVSITSTIQSSNYYGFGTQESEGAGSGFIIAKTKDSLMIATNNHVVSDATTLTVGFVDDTTAKATVVGTDSSADLAVISVKIKDIKDSTASKIKVATLGSSDDLKVGEEVVAIGNALGYGQSVTGGYISALNRQVQLTDKTMTLIQTDAAINPGNSGGALLNSKGELIGINTVKYSSEDVEGMGYAIPINTAKPIINKLIKNEATSESEQAYLGVSGQTIDSSMASQFDMPSGVYVQQVIKSSPAQKAGISAGDVIVSFNGSNVSTMDGLKEKISNLKAGKKVKVVVKRQNQMGTYEKKTLTVTLGKKSDAPSTSSNSSNSNSNSNNSNSYNNNYNNESSNSQYYSFGQ